MSQDASLMSLTPALRRLSNLSLALSRCWCPPQPPWFHCNSSFLSPFKHIASIASCARWPSRPRFWCLSSRWLIRAALLPKGRHVGSLWIIWSGWDTFWWLRTWLALSKHVSIARNTHSVLTEASSIQVLCIGSIFALLILCSPITSNVLKRRIYTL